MIKIKVIYHLNTCSHKPLSKYRFGNISCRIMFCIILLEYFPWIFYNNWSRYALKCFNDFLYFAIFYRNKPNIFSINIYNASSNVIPLLYFRISRISIIPVLYMLSICARVMYFFMKCFISSVYIADQVALHIVTRYQCLLLIIYDRIFFSIKILCIEVLYQQ